MLTIVWTALKQLPLKDYVYVSLILILLALFGLFAHHERAVGAAAIQSADARAAALQLVHTSEVESRAKQLTDSSLDAYRVAIAAPVAPDAPSVLVCQQPAAADPVPGDASPRGRTHAAAAVSTDLAPVGESTVEHPIDIGPETDRQFRNADAEITALQAYIRACQAEGICAK